MYEAYVVHIDQSRAIETHFHDKLGPFFWTPISEHKGAYMTYIGAAKNCSSIMMTMQHLYPIS